MFPFHLSEEFLFFLTQLGRCLAVRRRVHRVRLDHLDGDRVADLDLRRVWPADVLIRPGIQTPDAQIQIAWFARVARPAHVRADDTAVADTDGAKGPAGVTSPLDVLADLSDDAVREAVAATRRLG